jgi:hypothetical protein
MKNRTGWMIRFLAVSVVAGLTACATDGGRTQRTAADSADSAKPSTGTHDQQEAVYDQNGALDQGGTMGGSGDQSETLQSADTVYLDSSWRTPGTGGSMEGGGVGGTDADPAVRDTQYILDTSLYHYEPPTGVSPDEPGTGGGIPPRPDSLRGDTLAPPDTAALPEGRAMPGNGSGPDVF